MPKAETTHTTTAEWPRAKGSYIAKSLSVLAYATGGATFFHYHHTGPLDDVLAPDFFADDDVSLFGHRSRLSITAADGIANVLCDCRAAPMAFVLMQRVDLPAAAPA